MGIVSYSGIGLYPPFVRDIINASWDLGIQKSDEFSGKIQTATSGILATAPTVTAGSAATPEALTAQAVLAPDPFVTPTVDAPVVIEPTVEIPVSASVGDLMESFDSKYLELVQMLAERFNSFRATYFPDETAQYAALTAWVQDALADPSGLPAGVAAQLLTDDKDRILSDAGRASEAIIAQFAARRFPLPPGAAVAAVAEIGNKAQDEIAASGRNLVKLSIDQVRFVIDKAISLRQMAMDSALKYITALASGPDIATRLVGIGYDAQSKLISSASQWYNSRTAVAELQAKVGQFNAGTALDAAVKSADVQTKVGQFNVSTSLDAASKTAELQSKVGQFNVSTALEAGAKNQAAELTLIEARLKALLSEAQAIAQMTTSLFNNIHASAGVSASDSVTTSL